MIFFIIFSQIIQNSVLEIAFLGEFREQPGNDSNQGHDSQNQTQNKVNTGEHIPCFVTVNEMVLFLVFVPQVNQPSPHGNMECEEQHGHDFKEISDCSVFVTTYDGEKKEGNPDQGSVEHDLHP
jgi:hypothetical protein